MKDSRITGLVPYVKFTQAEGGSSHECDVLIELKKVDGEAEDENYVMDVYASNSSVGNGIATTGSDSSATVDSGYGKLLDTVLSAKHWLVSTSSTGQCKLIITSSGDVGMYICVRDPRTGRVNVSNALTEYAA